MMEHTPPHPPRKCNLKDLLSPLCQIVGIALFVIKCKNWRRTSFSNVDNSFAFGMISSIGPVEMMLINEASIEDWWMMMATHGNSRKPTTLLLTLVSWEI
jgi:hypothetical protein